jgi:hypothetical protein
MDDWLIGLLVIGVVLLLTVAIMAGWFGGKKPSDE